MMTESTTSDSTASEAGAPAAADDDQFDLAADLDEAIGTEPEPSPQPADNGAGPAAAPQRAPDAVPAQQADLDQIDPNSATERERNLLADYTRKSQHNAEVRRALEAQQGRLDQREARLSARPEPDPNTTDPLSALRATLNEGEQRALDVVQAINEATMGKQLEGFGSRFETVENVVRALATQLIQERTRSANTQADEARAVYPDIDAYADQVNALTAVTNPATKAHYTPQEAYELVRGISASRSAELNQSDTAARVEAAVATQGNSSIPVSDPGGEYSTNQVLTELKKLGFD